MRYNTPLKLYRNVITGPVVIRAILTLTSPFLFGTLVPAAYTLPRLKSCVTTAGTGMQTNKE